MPKERIELIARGVLARDGRLLVCRNVKNKHAFLPGGHVEYGESSAEALAREMREEAGIEVTVGEFLGVFESSFVQARGDKPPKHHHELNVLFQMTVDESTVIRSLESKIEFIWLKQGDPNDISRLLPAGIIDIALDPAMLGSSMSE